MAKVFYDTTVNKEVYDVSGNCTKEICIANHGLSEVANVQEVTITGDLASELVDGVLQTFDSKARASTEAINKETARQAKEDSIKTVLSLTDEQFADLKQALE